MRVAVVGAHGQLGAALVGAFTGRHDVVALTRQQLDLADDTAVARVMGEVRPDAIVNAAAYNAVDEAEVNPAEALTVNAFAVRALARAASEVGAKLVHYSSDFVFDGTATAPYDEQARPNPRSFYAASKLMGEWFAGEAPAAWVLRVESLFGRADASRPPRGSVAGILNALVEGREAPVFIDRTISPTYITDAAMATMRLLEQPPAPGVYHCVNSGSCTWWEFALELARLAGREPRFKPVRMADVALRASRPQYCALSNAKLAAAGIPMPSWQDALSRFVESEARV